MHKSVHTPKEHFDSIRPQCIIPASMPKAPSNPFEVGWGRTEKVQDRLRPSAEFVPPKPGDQEAPYGRYSGRPVIGSGMSRIIGGVYLGANAREAIVVDDSPENPAGQLLDKIYRERFQPLLRQLAIGYRSSLRDTALFAVYQAVLQTMPYNARMTREMVEHYTGGQPDKKLHLAVFAYHHLGVCRHQALLAAYLLEKLLTEKDKELRLKGSFSVERNQLASSDESLELAHVWVRYTTSDGEVFILDPAQQKFGRLRDLIGKPGAWEYARPEDLAGLGKK